ncbi:MAG: hypothetical protein K6A05_03895 [Lachnospiraceae bacterium]|nr:hypothetical protein [Lachnospiraceae bacterium]
MKRLFKNKKIIISLAAFAVAAIGLVSTYAVLTAQTNPVVNTFSPEVVETVIEEDLDETTLGKDVTIRNIGPSDAFVRARVTISPEGVANPTGIEDDWQYEDGWYYYRVALRGTDTDSSASDVTSSLMKQVKLTDADFEGDFDVTVYQEAVGTGGIKAGNKATVKQIQKLFNAINQTTEE